MKPIIYWGALIQTAITCAVLNFMWMIQAVDYGNLVAALGSLCIAIFGSLITYNWLIWGKPQWKDENDL